MFSMVNVRCSTVQFSGARRVANLFVSVVFNGECFEGGKGGKLGSGARRVANFLCPLFSMVNVPRVARVARVANSNL